MKPKLAQRLQLAFQQMQAGDLNSASAACEQILRKAPREPDTLHLLGLIRKQQGQNDAALALMRSSIAAAPQRANFYANLGNLLSKLARYDDAIAAYRSALKRDSGFRQARLGLARALVSAGLYPQAQAEAEDLLAHDARDAEAHVALGLALAGQGVSDRSEKAYRAALAIAPDYGVAHHNLGALLGKTGKVEESLRSLERAASAGIRGVEIDFNRASALLKLYRFDDGEALLSQVVESAPGYSEAQKLLAQCRFMRGSGDFMAALRSAVHAEPDNAQLQLALSQVLHGANELMEAEDALNEALEHCGQNPRLLAMLATVNQEAGRYDDALRCARSAIAADPDDARLVDFEIDALMSLGDAEAARPLIEAARRRSPNNQWYLAIQATAARLMKDPLYESLCDYEQFVRTYDLEAPKPWTSMTDFHVDLLRALEARHQFQAHPLDQSLRLGTQTPRNLVNDPDPIIQAFLAALQKPIERYRESIGYDDIHPLRQRNKGEAVLTGCWSVRLRRGGFHVNHVHPDGWISSAYYVQVPDEVADVQARSGWIKFGEPRYPIPGVDAEKYVQPREGRLVLFPAYCWHGTTPIRGDEPRMTMAFDVVTDRQVG